MVELKPGTRGFQAGPLSNQKSIDWSRFKSPLKEGRHLPNRRDW